MSDNTPIILIELVLVFGGALLFAWWQLHSIKVDQRKAAERRAAEQRAPEAAVAPTRDANVGTDVEVTQRNGGESPTMPRSGDR